jgi:hypothetical protein
MDSIFIQKNQVIMTKVHRKFLLSATILLLCTFAFEHVNAQENWELRKESDGIRVYTSEIPESSYKAFRAECEIKADNITAIAAAILDVKNYILWMPDTEEATLIKKFDDSHDIHYVLTGAPWPVNDRDGVYEQKASYFKIENKVVIQLDCLTEYDFPKKNKVVRMTVGTGYWEISDSGNGKFKLIYQYHAEPGGSIPAWLANTSVVDIPFDLMTNLRAMIEEGKYDDAKLDFIY